MPIYLFGKHELPMIQDVANRFSNLTAGHPIFSTMGNFATEHGNDAQNALSHLEPVTTLHEGYTAALLVMMLVTGRQDEKLRSDSKFRRTWEIAQRSMSEVANLSYYHERIIDKNCSTVRRRAPLQFVTNAQLFAQQQREEDDDLDVVVVDGVLLSILDDVFNGSTGIFGKDLMQAGALLAAADVENDHWLTPHIQNDRLVGVICRRACHLVARMHDGTHWYLGEMGEAGMPFNLPVSK